MHVPRPHRANIKVKEIKVERRRIGALEVQLLHSTKETHNYSCGLFDGSGQKMGAAYHSTERPRFHRQADLDYVMEFFVNDLLTPASQAKLTLNDACRVWAAMNQEALRGVVLQQSVDYGVEP